MNEISGLVITLNESRNIVDCLRSMKQICDDIVVVDSGSIDNTVELAKAEGATVIVQKPFLGDGPQRTHGLPYCRHQWILNLDADERLEDDFVQYVKRTNLDDLGVDLIQTRRRNLIGDRFTPHVGQYPDYVKRLFRKDRAWFIPVVAHTYVEEKCKYAGWLAKNLADSDKRLYSWQPFMHGFWSFLSHYVFKSGFLVGLDGLTLSICKGVGAYLKYAHAIEIRRARKNKINE